MKPRYTAVKWCPAVKRGLLLEAYCTEGKDLSQETEITDERQQASRHSAAHAADLKLVAGRGLDEMVCLGAAQPSLQAILS